MPSSSDLLLGIEGLALLRGAIAGSDEEAARRVAAIRALAESPDERLSEAVAFPERSVEQGYAAWSKTYDAPGNPLIQLEETVLLPLLASLPPGRALDAACGTGRVSERLAAAGHEVVGIDATTEMLAVARARVPAARFAEGRLEAPAGRGRELRYPEREAALPVGDPAGGDRDQHSPVEPAPSEAGVVGARHPRLRPGCGAEALEQEAALVAVHRRLEQHQPLEPRLERLRHQPLP